MSLKQTCACGKCKLKTSLSDEEYKTVRTEMLNGYFITEKVREAVQKLKFEIRNTILSKDVEWTLINDVDRIFGPKLTEAKEK